MPETGTTLESAASAETDGLTTTRGGSPQSLTEGDPAVQSEALQGGPAQSEGVPAPLQLTADKLP